jgi:beta-galactosidase
LPHDWSIEDLPPLDDPELPAPSITEGPGRILAVSNGNPRSVESFQQPQRKAFRGPCQVAIQPAGRPGQIRLTAEADGLKPVETVVRAG